MLSYGLIAATKTVVHDMQRLTSVMPGDAAKLVGEQLKNVVETSGSTKVWIGVENGTPLLARQLPVFLRKVRVVKGFLQAPIGAPGFANFYAIQ